MAEFSLKDTLLFGGLLLGAGVIIRKIDESPEEVSEEVEVCESCVWVPTSIGTRNFIANCGGCGAEIKAPISQFREIVDVETLDAEELDEKVKNLIKVGDMKFREYADGTLERFEGEFKGKNGVWIYRYPLPYRPSDQRVRVFNNMEDWFPIWAQLCEKFIETKTRENRERFEPMIQQYRDDFPNLTDEQLKEQSPSHFAYWSEQLGKFPEVAENMVMRKNEEGKASGVYAIDLGVKRYNPMGNHIVNAHTITYNDYHTFAFYPFVEDASEFMDAESFDAEQVDYDVLLDGELMGIHESLESAKEAAEKLYVENGKSLGVEVLQMKYDDETLEGDVNGEQVFKLGAESFDAESVSDLEFQKDSCCCGATKKTPCVCMILGSDCSAKKPMCACFRLKAIQQKDEKGAETFEAEADSSNCVWCGSSNVCCTNEDSQNKVKGIKNRFGEYAIEASPMPHPTKEEYVCGKCCFIHGDKSVLIPNLIESSEMGHPLEEYEVLVSNNNMEFGLSHNTFRDKEEALDAALNLSQEQTDKFIYVRRDDGKVIRVFRPNHGYGAETFDHHIWINDNPQRYSFYRCGCGEKLRYVDDKGYFECSDCGAIWDGEKYLGLDEVWNYCENCGMGFDEWDGEESCTTKMDAESRPASYMVKSDAHKLKEASKRIHEKADEHQKYPEWWKSKLSVSRNNADQLADFLDYAVIEGVFESEQHGDDEDDHEEIDELIEKLNTVVDFAITFIHDGGYGGEPKGTFVDTELGIKTEVVEYVEGSIQLRLVRDIDTDELLSVRFSLSGEPEETPIVYLPLPERLTLIPEDERSSK